MLMMTVQYPPEALDQGRKDALAEALTKVILAIEGGADIPEGRSIAWFVFSPRPARTGTSVGATTVLLRRRQAAG